MPRCFSPLNNSYAVALTILISVAECANGRFSTTQSQFRKESLTEYSSFLYGIRSIKHDSSLLSLRGGDNGDDKKVIRIIDGETGYFDIDESSNHNKTTFQHQQPFCFRGYKAGDGSESDPDCIPKRFIKMQKGNRLAAKNAFNAHMAWREEHDVDTILSRPHSKFDCCKAVLPHYFSGRDVKGNPIFVQRPGGIDFELARKNHVDMETILMHQVYVLEYCWNIFEPKPDGVMTSVVDFDGVGWKTLQDQEIMSFCKKFVKMMSDNYPQRSYRTLIVNAPRWFGALYRLFKPLLRESTKKKIEIHTAGASQDRVLRKLLGESLPLELLSTNTKSTGPNMKVSSSTQSNDDPIITTMSPGPNSEVEKELRDHCINILEQDGVEMRLVTR